MYSEGDTSPPRLSFSRDFVSKEADPIEACRNSYYLGSNSDFEFSFITKNGEDSSSADDLFCNGVIVPIQSRNKNQISEKPSNKKPLSSSPLPPLPPPFAENPQKTAMVDSSELEEKQRPKSFWGFKRSSSLNCAIEWRTIFSIPLLSRSNSTGSNSNQKRSTSKENPENFLEKQTATGKSSAPPLLYSSSSRSFCQRKIQRGFYGSYLWINPVLNLPPPYISKRTTNLFGFGSCLPNGKEKHSKK